MPKGDYQDNLKSFVDLNPLNITQLDKIGDILRFKEKYDFCKSIKEKTFTKKTSDLLNTLSKLLNMSVDLREYKRSFPTDQLILKCKFPETTEDMIFIESLPFCCTNNVLVIPSSFRLFFYLKFGFETIDMANYIKGHCCFLSHEFQFDQDNMKYKFGKYAFPFIKDLLPKSEGLENPFVNLDNPHSFNFVFESDIDKKDLNNTDYEISPLTEIEKIFYIKERLKQNVKKSQIIMNTIHYTHLYLLIDFPDIPSFYFSDFDIITFGKKIYQIYACRKRTKSRK